MNASRIMGRDFILDAMSSKSKRDSPAWMLGERITWAYRDVWKGATKQLSINQLLFWSTLDILAHDSSYSFVPDEAQCKALANGFALSSDVTLAPVIDYLFSVLRRRRDAEKIRSEVRATLPDRTIQKNKLLGGMLLGIGAGYIGYRLGKRWKLGKQLALPKTRVGIS